MHPLRIACCSSLGIDNSSIGLHDLQHDPASIARITFTRRTWKYMLDMAGGSTLETGVSSFSSESNLDDAPDDDVACELSFVDLFSLEDPDDNDEVLLTVAAAVVLVELYIVMN